MAYLAGLLAIELTSVAILSGVQAWWGYGFIEPNLPGLLLLSVQSWLLWELLWARRDEW